MSQHLVGYVINLARQPERLEKFYRQAPAQFFQTVSAVDRKNLELLDLNLVFDLASCERQIHRFATAGEIGCTLSHTLCWKKIALNPQLNPMDFALVAEDDVIFCDQFTDIIKGLIDYITPFEHIDLVILQKLGLHELGWQDKFYHGESQIKLETASHYCADGSSLYLIRQSLAKELTAALAQQKPFWLADWFNVFCDKSKIRISVPLLGYVPEGLDSPSDIEEERQVARQNSGG